MTGYATLLASAPPMNGYDAKVASGPSPPASTGPAEVADTPNRPPGQVPPSWQTATTSPAEQTPSLHSDPDRIDAVLASFASAGLDPVLVGAGDIADCMTGADMATARLVEGIRGLVFTAGDEAYPDGSARRFHDCYGPSWGRFRDRTLPAVGNHEYGTPRAAGHFGYFGPERGRPGQAWYSLDVGAWHVIVLDSDCDIVGCGPGSAQLAWLEADLAARPAPCTLAIWHHPRFSSGSHGNDRAVGPFWSALMAAGAELVINGHDHDYERFAPQTPGGRLARADGVREFVVGTGGAHLYRFHAIRANSRLRLSTHGVLRLTLHAASYDWQFIGTDNSIGDAGTSPCH